MLFVGVFLAPWYNYFNAFLFASKNKINITSVGSRDILPIITHEQCRLHSNLNYDLV